MKNYFKDSEIRCKCGCGYVVRNIKLLGLANVTRELYGKPLIVSSWCRCENHNRAEGGKSHSAHLTGEAIDFICLNSADRMMLLSVLLSVGFQRIGISKTFIHADISDTLPQNVIWVYS